MSHDRDLADQDVEEVAEELWTLGEQGRDRLADLRATSQVAELDAALESSPGAVSCGRRGARRAHVRRGASSPSGRCAGTGSPRRSSRRSSRSRDEKRSTGPPASWSTSSATAWPTRSARFSATRVLSRTESRSLRGPAAASLYADDRAARPAARPAARRGARAGSSTSCRASASGWRSCRTSASSRARTCSLQQKEPAAVLAHRRDDPRGRSRDRRRDLRQEGLMPEDSGFRARSSRRS